MNGDIAIRDDIVAEFGYDPRLDAEAIGVTVEHGAVTLTGHVPDFAQKVAAENAAWATPGVTQVTDNILVE